MVAFLIQIYPRKDALLMQLKFNATFKLESNGYLQSNSPIYENYLITYQINKHITMHLLSDTNVSTAFQVDSLLRAILFIGSVGTNNTIKG